ncbi:Co2+/Mg2+ efflux protein ApaG [Lysobacter sp. HA18]
MNDGNSHAIGVEVQAHYVESESSPDHDRYVFAYTVRVQNQGTVAAQLLGRHWVITDAHGQVREVEGDGVVGHQPHLEPGQAFEYTSGAVLETDLGTMRGSYRMQAEDGTRFEAPIPAFTLTVPRTLH